MTITIKINTGNAAFKDGEGSETARILRKLADKIEGVACFGVETLPLIDANGNRIGEMEVRP